MESKQIKKKVVTKEIYYAHCKFCIKYVESEHLDQLVYNLKTHEDSCKDNPDINK